MLKSALMMTGLLLSAPVFAAEPAPEMQRAPGTAQAIGAPHTLRQIPEACARLEGVFTGNAAQPYTFSVTRSSPTCQPRSLRRLRQGCTQRGLRLDFQ